MLHGRESHKNFVELELPLIVNTQILAVLAVFDASHKLLVHTLNWKLMTAAVQVRSHPQRPDWLPVPSMASQHELHLHR